MDGIFVFADRLVAVLRSLDVSRLDALDNARHAGQVALEFTGHVHQALLILALPGELAKSL